MSLNQTVEELVKEGKAEEAFRHAVNAGTDALNLASAVSFQNLGDYETAARLLRAAVELNPNQLSYRSNLVYLLGRQKKFEEAVQVAETAEAVCGAGADLLYNKAVVYQMMEEYERSITAYRRAIELAPDYAILHYNLGSLLIQTGHILEGLKEYEWRFKSHEVLIKFRKRYDKPDWDGLTDLAGKTVAVFNEQGCGDAVQSVRFVPVLRSLGVNVVLEVQEELRSLFEDSECADQVVGRSHNTEEPTSLPPHDYVVSFMSLPYLIYTYIKKPLPPCPFPYLKTKSKTSLHPGLIAKNKKKIGVVWAGSPWHPGDKERSMPLARFAEISSLPNVRLYSLQKGPMDRVWDGIEFNLLERSGSVKLTKLGELLGDFSDTARVMQDLDLVVTVDTTVAHLAGALNIPVWLLLQKHCDWRWFTEGETTPWYRSMKLFRQPAPGDWDTVMTQVKDALHE